MPLRSPTAIGAIVREARETAGLTQAELAREIGTSRHSILRLEQGRPGVELATVLKAVDRLGLELSITPYGTPQRTRRTYAARPAKAIVPVAAAGPQPHPAVRPAVPVRKSNAPGKDAPRRGPSPSPTLRERTKPAQEARVSQGTTPPLDVILRTTLR